jgi:hypothetical protein
MSHPWSDFLHARALCLRWLRDERGESPEKICQTMAMDPVQVRLILAYVDETAPPTQNVTSEGE